VIYPALPYQVRPAFFVLNTDFEARIDASQKYPARLKMICRSTLEIPQNLYQSRQCQLQHQQGLSNPCLSSPDPIETKCERL
jgi:hypothetical protein